MKNLLGVLVLAVLLTVGSRSAMAERFSARGFTQGMSKVEVENLSTKEGYKVVINSAVNWSISRGNKPFAFLDFCEGKLTRLGYIVDGGLMNFLSVIEDFTKSGAYEPMTAGARTFIGYDSMRHGSLTLYLHRKIDEFFIEFTLYGQEKYDVTNSQVSYVEKGGKPDCGR
jgi:hypothetical protein